MPGTDQVRWEEDWRRRETLKIGVCRADRWWFSIVPVRGALIRCNLVRDLDSDRIRGGIYRLNLWLRLRLVQRGVWL